MKDWAPGTKIRHARMEIVFGGGSGEEVEHIGLGYEVVLPSGRVADRRGWTWHNSEEVRQLAAGHNVPLIGAEHRAQEQHLADLIRALRPALESLLRMEGIDEIAPPERFETLEVNNGGG